MSKLTSIVGPGGNRVTFINHPMFHDIPVSPSRDCSLIPPYFSENKDPRLNYTHTLQSINVFHDKDNLIIGSVFITDKGDRLRVMENTVVIEDFFEDFFMTTCQSVSLDKINMEAREIWYMYSA